MNASDIAAELEAFIRQQFHVAPNDPNFDRTTDLFGAGYVDSVGVIETLAFIGERFDVEVPEEALLSESFTTIEGMAEAIAGLVQDARARPVSAAG